MLKARSTSEVAVDSLCGLSVLTQSTGMLQPCYSVACGPIAASTLLDEISIEKMQIRPFFKAPIHEALFALFYNSVRLFHPFVRPMRKPYHET